MLVRVIANTVGPVRTEKLEGRDHWVAPMVMLVEGVVCGSNGPLYYPRNELNAKPSAWNHMPIVVYHPEYDGQPISARSPDILNKMKIGVVLNAGCKVEIINGMELAKLTAEAWIDKERAGKIDQRVVNAITTNNAMEVSTGLSAQFGLGGTWNERQYIATVQNMEPDHLAILPDQVGACSLADGAGLLVNQEEIKRSFVYNSGWTQAKRDATPLADFGDPDKRAYPVETQKDLEDAARLIGHSDRPEYVKKRLIAIAKRKNLALPASWVQNEQSYSARSGAVRTAVYDQFNGDVYLEDVYEDFAIIEKDGGLWKVPYTIDAGVATLGTQLDSVLLVSEYRTADGTFVGNASTATKNRKEDKLVDKKKVIDALIANTASGWVEADRELLMAMTEPALEKITANAKSAAPPKKEEEQKPPVTPPVTNEKKGFDDLLKEADPTTRASIENMRRLYDQRKTALVAAIIANKANTFTADQLNAKDVAELEAINNLATPTQAPTQAPVGGPLYMGSFGAPPTVANTQGVDEKQDALVAPAWDAKISG